MTLYIREDGLYYVKDNDRNLTISEGEGLSEIDFDDLPEDIKDEEIKEEI